MFYFYFHDLSGCFYWIYPMFPPFFFVVFTSLTTTLWVITTSVSRKYAHLTVNYSFFPATWYVFITSRLYLVLYVYAYASPLHRLLHVKSTTSLSFKLDINLVLGYIKTHFETPTPFSRGHTSKHTPSP